MGLFDSFFSSAVDAADSLVAGEEIVGAADVAGGGIPWGTIATAAAGGLNFLGQKGANSANMQIAQNQMDFQREMSNTAYQRAVKDMQAAGLNPMLAYSQGGASSPVGASTTVQNKFSGAVQAAQAQQMQNEALKQVQSQTTVNNSVAAKNNAETLLAAQELKNRSQLEINYKADLQRILAAAKREGASALQLDQLAKSIEQAMKISQPAANWAQENPTLAKWIHGIGTIIRPAVGAAGVVKGLK
jgi:hypothetical protein